MGLFSRLNRKFNDPLKPEPDPVSFDVGRNYPSFLSFFDEVNVPSDTEQNEEVCSPSQTNEITSHKVEDQEKQTSQHVLKHPVQEDINLLISYTYNNLDPNLKLCLQCFCIFPENSIIKVRSLIYWWIGEGLMNDEKDKTAEEVAKYHCKNLMDMGLINHVKKKSFSLFDSCTAHPWLMHIMHSDMEDRTRTQAEDSTSSGLVSVTTCKRENSLTLFNVELQYLKFKRGRFAKRKNIVILQLGKWQNSSTYPVEVHDTEFLEDLKGQKQLRYLSLQGVFGVRELPPYIKSLTNLIILDLRACHSLEKLPPGIASMKKLTHLDVSSCHLLEYMPKGVQHLSELQVLKGFVIDDSPQNDSCKLGDLALKLKKLQKLSIVLERQDGSVLFALMHLQSLRILTIIWGNKPESIDSKGDPFFRIYRSILPKNLEKLELQCFPERVLPIWLRPGEVHNLKRLYIKGGRLESLMLNNVRQSWNVKIVSLKFLLKLSIEWSELLQVFPNADYIENVRCPYLKSSPLEGVWERRKTQKIH